MTSDMGETTERKNTLNGMAASRSDAFNFLLEDIETVEGWNVRDKTVAYWEAIDALAQDIIAKGVTEPLKGYYDKSLQRFVITNGHRRRDALVVAQDKYGVTGIKVPVIPEDRYANETDRLETLIRSNSGVPLTALETAEVFRRLHNHGRSLEEIAKLSQLSSSPLGPAQISNLLHLSSATPETKDAIRAGDVKPTTVVDAVKEHGPDKAGEVIREVVATAKQSGKRATGAAVKRAAKPKESRLGDKKEMVDRALALMVVMRQCWPPEKQLIRHADNVHVVITASDAMQIQSLLDD